jgi:hypothetical protein
MFEATSFTKISHTMNPDNSIISMIKSQKIHAFSNHVLSLIHVSFCGLVKHLRSICRGLEIEVQVLKSRSGDLPRVIARFFFSRPFPVSCPGLIPGFFFFPPFPSGLPELFFFLAFFRRVRCVGAGPAQG